MMSASSPPSADPPEAPRSEEDVRPAPGAGRLPLVERSIESLDWPRILAALAERASTTLGQRLATGLEFHDHAVGVRAALAGLSEMMALHAAGSAPPLGSIEDVGPMLAGARRGEVLPSPAVIQIAHTLEGLGRLHRHLGEQATLAPRLYAFSHRIRPLPDLAAHLVTSFDPRGELSVSTYPQLSALRGRKAKLHSRIRETLDSLQRSARFSDSLQDDFVAMRNDRYVVPVKAAQKRAGLGIVHDTSGSGQTVFVEPYEVIELNNDLKIADAELRREELRILRDLSDRIAQVSGDVDRGLGAAAQLDLIAAKAVLARDLTATVPEVPDEPRIRLIAARHPILELRGLDVIPNDITLGGKRRALVISGPNTGGKTVTLKTMGLAALLVRAGMAVPAEEGSVVGFFDAVLTDIGDQQDVEEDLSTFSGHVLCMVEILEQLASDEAAGGALVLIDEIAVGTDPVQGAALGRALLLALLDRGAILATTTHYPELKALSATDERFSSARVEFDSGEGRPTYRLSVGKPGSSHALDVAARVGLPPEILEAARAMLDPTTADVEDLLAGLEAELRAARASRVEAAEDRSAARREVAESRAERKVIEERSKHLDKTLRAEFEKEVRGYRASVRGALREIKQKQEVAVAERARQRINDGANQVRARLPDTEVATPGVDPASLVVGAPIRISTLSKNGKILAVPDKRGRVQVEVDGLKIQVKVSDLEPSTARPSKDGGKALPAARSGKPSGWARAMSDVESSSATAENAYRGVDNTLDLRGERVDDALELVDRYLDDASMASKPYIFVLHGHGTGVLKSAIREHLRRSSYSDGWVAGTRAQGGDGITVVRLK